MMNTWGDGREGLSEKEWGKKPEAEVGGKIGKPN